MRSRVLPLAVAAFVAAACVSSALAQTPWPGALPVHRHIAPIDSSVTSAHQPNTPMFNLGNNGTWDLGEGLAADQGGAIDFDPNSAAKEIVTHGEGDIFVVSIPDETSILLG